MKFTITKSNFLDGLNHVSRVIAPNSLFEILKGIKIELEKDKLILKASDSLVSVEYSVNSYEDDKEVITIEKEGQVVLPSRNFIEIIRKAPTDLIEIERIKKACVKEAFLLRSFTLEERRCIEGRPERAAGNFAVKEAVSKVMGT